MPRLKHKLPINQRPFRELPPKKRAFVMEYVKCGNAAEAYKRAGYNITKTIGQSSSRLKMELTHHIEAKIKEYASSVELAAVAMSHLRDLAENAESESVRLGAVKEMLSRALPEDTHKEVTINHQVTNLTDDEIDKRIAQLSREVNGNVIDVVPDGQARIPRSA